MPATPLVTVVTVTYNSSKFVREAIESVLSSSYTNLELIIGDDASTDNTWSIIQEYKDSRIVAYRNESNVKEYANRNKAISLSSGEYLIFIDGDDMIYPHGLDFMVKMLEAFPECAMALMWWNQNDIFFPVVITPKKFYIGEYFGRGVLGSAFSNVIFRTEVLKKEGGLSNRYRNGDDYIRYKIAAKHNVLIINDGMTWWRETPGQASQVFRNTNSYIEEAFLLKFEFLNSVDCPLSKEDRDLARHNLCLLLTKMSIKMMIRGKLSGAIRIFRKFNLPFRYLLRLNYGLIKKNPFDGFSPANAFRLPLERNPYSVRMQVPVKE